MGLLIDYDQAIIRGDFHLLHAPTIRDATYLLPHKIRFPAIYVLARALQLPPENWAIYSRNSLRYEGIEAYSRGAPVVVRKVLNRKTINYGLFSKSSNEKESAICEDDIYFASFLD